MPGAGELRERVTFGRRGTIENESGTETGGEFAPLFDRAAKITPVNGGEQIVAGRLAGTRTVIVTVYFDSETSDITTTDNLTLQSTGEAFNIREVKDPDMKRRWLEMLCQSGVTQ